MFKIWEAIEDIHAFCKLMVNIELNTTRTRPIPVQPQEGPPLTAISGAHCGPFNLNSAILAGTPLGGRIWECSQTSTEPVLPVPSTGISTGVCTGGPAPQYVPRREFLAKRELLASTPASSGELPARKTNKKATVSLIPLSDPRVDPFTVAMQFADATPTILACQEANYDDNRLRTFLARAFPNRRAKHATLMKDTRNMAEFLEFCEKRCLATRWAAAVVSIVEWLDRTRIRGEVRLV